MRVPLSWLRDYVDFDLPAGAARRAADAARHGGQELERIGADWSSVVVGELLDGRAASQRRSPVADHRACRETASRCRSCAARPTSPSASACRSRCPGAVLPGGRRIGVTAARASRARACSARAPSWGSTTDCGRHPHPRRRGTARTRSAGRWPRSLGDIVLDVDVKPNRGDALSLDRASRVRWRRDHRTDGPLAGDRTVPEPGRLDRRLTCRVEVADRGCARASSAAMSTGSPIGPSPLTSSSGWLAAGMRPISNVVDAATT